MNRPSAVFSCLFILTIVSMTACATGVPREEAAIVYFDLGNAYVELGKYTEAVASFEKAMSLDPGLVKATYNLAQVYIEGKEPDKAIEILSDLLKRDPENSILLETLAYARYKSGDYDGALDLYEQILGRDPQYTNALYNAAVLLMGREEYEKARTYLETLSRLDSSADILYRLGLLELKTGNTSVAVDYLKQYLEKNADDEQALEALGDALTIEEYYEEALAYYDKALAVKEKNPDVLFSKARIYLLFIEDEKEGMGLLNEAIDQGFRDGEAASALLDELAASDLLEEITELFTAKKIITSDEEKEGQPGESEDSSTESDGQTGQEGKTQEENAAN